jgi:hypothetical protein
VSQEGPQKIGLALERARVSAGRRGELLEIEERQILRRASPEWCGASHAIAF